MCLYIKKSRHLNLKPKIAKRDIFCYKLFKVTDDGLKSPFRGTSWRENDIVYGRIKPDNFQINPHYSVAEKCYYVNHGIHSFKKIPRHNTRGEYVFRLAFSNCIVVKCIIPKGAQYWVGKDNEYCSDRLQLYY